MSRLTTDTRATAPPVRPVDSCYLFMLWDLQESKMLLLGPRSSVCLAFAATNSLKGKAKGKGNGITHQENAKQHMFLKFT